MFARVLTWCTLAISAVAVGCVARTAWVEFEWLDHLIANLFVGVMTPAYAACLPIILARLGWAARRYWPAAVGILLLTIWVSVVTIYCWAVADPSGPEGDGVLMIARVLGVGIAAVPPVLALGIVAAIMRPPQPSADGITGGRTAGGRRDATPATHSPLDLPQ